MKYALLFVGVMLAGLTLLTLVPREGPRDDPVHGQWVPSPLQQAIIDHRDAWRAELAEGQRTTPCGYYNSVVLRRYDAAASSPDVWEERAWWQVYREWVAEDHRNGYGQAPRIEGPFQPGNYSLHRRP